MMKKWVLAFLAAVSQFTLTAFAMPVELNLLGGGLSVLDSLLLIGVGIALIGILFLCIAFVKPQKSKEETEDGFLQQLIEETAIQTAAESLDEEEAEDLSEEEAEEEPLPEEEPIEEATPEEMVEEPAAEEPEEEPIEEMVEEEPQEEKVYPTLTLTGINNGEFKILPLKDAVTLGRRPDNDLIFTDTTVSGLHCEITVEEDKVYLTDKNSTNGTYLNGEKITEKTQIQKGDIMVLGQMELKISI